MKKLKIIQIVGDGSMTGAPRHVLLLATELKRRGHRILAIAPPGPIVNSLKEAKIAVAKIRMHSPLDRRADHAIRAVIEKYKPDIVHCHGTRGGWLGRLAARKIKDCAIVYTEHLWTKDYSIGNPVWHEFQLRGMKYIDKFTDVTIAVSKSVKDFLVKSKIVPQGKIVIVPNMLDPRFSEVARYRKPEGVPWLIGTVGSLNVQKGYLLLLESLALLKKQKLNGDNNWKAQIIGTGPLEKIIKRKIRKYRLVDKVSIIKKVSDICETMRHFTLYVQNSRSESFGMATMEAMALGIPAIVSGRGALPEIIEHGKTGLIVQFGKPEKLTKAIMQLVQDEKLYYKISKNARQTVLKKYSCDKVVDQIEFVYEKAIKNKQFKKSHLNRK